MKEKSRRMALCGVMCALGVAVMLLGGLIPLATFCCPALAGLVLLPVMTEAGRRMALCAYGAVAALSLLLCPDKEAALVFAFLGYYPVLKWTLERISRRPLRVAAKLAVFDAAMLAQVALMAWVLNMRQVLAEYAEMTRVMLAGFVVISNVTMLLYDRMLTVMTLIYLKKLRPKLFRSAPEHDLLKGMMR